MTWQRVATAAVLIPAVVGIVWWGSTALVAAAVGLVTVLALLEFFAIGEKMGLRGYRLWTCLCAVGLDFRFYGAFPYPAESILVLFVLGVALVALMSHRPLGEAFPALVVSSGALVLVALPLSYLTFLHSSDLSKGPITLLFVLVLIWAGDTAAYFVGRAVGQHRLAPEVSPKKTWEGAAANLAGSLLVGWIFSRKLAAAGIPLSHVLIAAALGSVAGQIGDLLESAYKRSAGVKDSGVILPGHGGVLDRIDALILAAPIVWYYFTLRWFPPGP